MTIEKKVNEKTMTLSLNGRLDAESAGQLEREIGDLAGVEGLVLYLKALSYISSAGLRVLLNAQQQLDMKNGSLVLKNVGEQVLDILEQTGFDKFVTIRNG